MVHFVQDTLLSPGSYHWKCMPPAHAVVPERICRKEDKIQKDKRHNSLLLARFPKNQKKNTKPYPAHM